MAREVPGSARRPGTVSRQEVCTGRAAVWNDVHSRLRGRHEWCGRPKGLGVSHPAARGILALVFARLYEQTLGLIFSSFFGALFENCFSRFFGTAALRRFSGQPNHTFLRLRVPNTIHTYIFYASSSKNHHKTARSTRCAVRAGPHPRLLAAHGRGHSPCAWSGLAGTPKSEGVHAAVKECNRGAGIRYRKICGKQIILVMPAPKVEPHGFRLGRQMRLLQNFLHAELGVDC
jgi:hypothetical protein